MAKKRKYQLVFLGLILTLAVSCTKSEVDTRRFMKEGRWQITQLEIGKNSSSAKPKWDIEKSEDADTSTPGTWTHADGSFAQFNWCFNYFAGTFSMKVDEYLGQKEDTKAFMQCYNLSGDYAVLTDERKLFEFESYSTNGYPESAVFIQIVPQ